MKFMLRLGPALMVLALAAFLTGVAQAGPSYTGMKVYIGQKNCEKAAMVGPKALEEDADKPDAYNKYAIALSELDSLEHAGILFQQGIALADKKGDAKIK